MADKVLLPSVGTLDVWQRMAEEKVPLFMYGTGNGADKIIDAMTSQGIPLSGVFASDGFVRSRSFRGFTVTSYSDVCENCDDFAVILAFGSSRPEVLNNVYRIASERILYCPDVPAVGNTLFTHDFYSRNFDKILSVYEAFADDESRRVYAEIIRYKLSGNIIHLSASAAPGDPSDGVLRFDKYESMLDLGAYTGDTVRDAIIKMPRLKRAIAVEPDSRAYKKLSAYAQTLESVAVTAINAAAWDEDTSLTFTSNASRGSTIDAGERSKRRGERDITVSAVMPDSAADGERIDYVKYDVEGAEERAIEGSKKLLLSDPDLLVSLYHRSEDIFELPLLVRELLPNHKLYLRRAAGVPAWDINLYAIYE